jgi:phage-related minor tail protein
MADQEIRIRLTAEGTAQSGAAFDKAAGSLKKVGEASNFTRQQLNQVSMQVTDIAVGLTSGQSPFTVLMQQGGQLKDMFGGVGGAARALGATLATMITPVTLAVGAGAGLAAMLFKGFEESNALRNSLILTGNAAGQTADSFELLTRNAARAGDVTIGTARDLTQGLVSTGEFGAKALETITVAAAKLQDMTGQSSESVIRDFAGMSAGVQAWAVEHNKAWHFVSDAQLEQIKSLEDVGDQQGAMVVAGQALIAHLGDQRANLGYLQIAWRETKEAASEFIDALASWGRDSTDLDKLQAARSELQQIRQMVDSPTSGWLAKLLFGGEDRAQQSVDTANRDVLRNFDTAKSRESDAERARQLGELSTLTERLHGGNTQYAKDLRQIQIASAANLITEKERIDLLTRAAVLYGPKPKAGKSPEELYRESLRETLANRAPRLADIEAKGYEEANRAAEANMAQQAEQLRRRNEQAQQLGQQYVEEAAQINISLIEDDKARGLAQIELERQVMQSRIDVLKEKGADVGAAQDALNRLIVAKQTQLADQLKPAWQRMTDGWKDATRTMRDTYDTAMDGILHDSEDAFVKLMRTGKLDLKGLAGNLSDTLWRGFFRQNVGGNVSSGAQSLLGMLGLSGGSGAKDNGGLVTDEFGRLAGFLDKQTDATSASTRSVNEFAQGLDAVSGVFGSAAQAVIQFVSGMTGGSGGFADLFKGMFSGSGGDSSGSGSTSGNMGLADYGLGGGRARGGTVKPGMDYWVGENGPERLRMYRGGGGYVTASGESAGASTGPVIHKHTHIYQAGVTPAMLQMHGEALAERVTAETLESAARPGRPLWRAARA